MEFPFHVKKNGLGLASSLVSPSSPSRSTCMSKFMAYSTPLLTNADNPLVSTAWEGRGHKNEEDEKS